MKNVKMILAYDGTDFLGWQNTGSGASVELTLQQCLETILQEKVALQAASRTDAGVHALGQVVNFVTNKELDLGKLKYRLNSLLPKTITICEIEEVSLSFHPTLDSQYKEYRYHICYDNLQLPHDRHHVWHYPHSLELSLMKKAATFFVGSHDFRSFCNVKKNSNYKDYERTIFSLEIESGELKELPNKNICITIRGDHFLYKMVRNIVGTLVYVGRGLITLDQILHLLKNNNRPSAGMTAPAHGLFLHKVCYD